MANVEGACEGLPLIYVVVLAGADTQDSVSRTIRRFSRTHP
jgi:hypothetical protein